MSCQPEKRRAQAGQALAQLHDALVGGLGLGETMGEFTLAETCCALGLHLSCFLLVTGGFPFSTSLSSEVLLWSLHKPCLVVSLALLGAAGVLLSTSRAF